VSASLSDGFDLIVIGAGPAGEKAAAQAAYFAKRVAIVERSAVPGGAAVGNAGIPTKTLRDAALYMSGFKKRDVYGVGIDLDPAAALERMRARTTSVIAGMRKKVALNIERHGIELIHGEARLDSDGIVTVRHANGSNLVLRARAVIIATGSRPFHPTDVPFDDPDVHDSESILRIKDPFDSVVVIGRGAVACEYASVFNALGVEVTLVDSSPHLAPFLDHDISDGLAASFANAGMRVLLERGRTEITRDEHSLRVGLKTGEVLRADKVLFAGGRTANSESLGLEDLGIERDKRGRIKVDSTYQTSVGGIYAAGDVIGTPGLASVSMEQGRVAACHACGISFKDTVDAQPPFGVYGIPEAASVGLSEQAASDRGIDYEIGIERFDHNTRAAISGDTDGMIKLVFERKTKTLLGVHLLGDAVSELVHQGQVLIHFNASIDHLIHMTFNVPTLSEAYKYAAYDGLQRIARREDEESHEGPPLHPAIERES
jgi:NAD(P) transhydrogenase